MKLDSEMFKLILDYSFDEIMVLDENNHIVYVNKACTKHYGMKPSEIIGKSYMEINNLNYWSPTITPLVLKEKRTISVIQTTHFGKKLLTTATPVLNDQEEIIFTIQNIRDLEQMEAIKRELGQTRKMLDKNYSKKDSPEIIAHGKRMKGTIKFAERVAGVDSTVLILGESGTGKGILARHIHNHSSRKEGPFLAINCAAIPDDLLESELYGYSQGAFTGADKGGKKGLVEMANGGTLFLDEIGELSPRMQAKVLQLIQEKQFRPIGNTQTKSADVRIVTATNVNLFEMAEIGRFRKDLYYRLNVVEIDIPSLRERLEDIVPLVYFFLNKFNKKYDVHHELSEKALDILCRYSWPGNVRELENLIERLVVTAVESTIDHCHLPKHILAPTKLEFSESLSIYTSIDEVKEKIERDLVTRSYKELGSSYKVAKALKVTQPRAWRLIKKYCNVSKETTDKN